jgi:hypothetical protein
MLTIEVMQAHWMSALIIVSTLLVTPFYWFLVMPSKEAAIMAWITAVVAAVMLTVNLFNIPAKLGPAGGALKGY